MPSTMSLNTRVHIVSKLGKKETITVRDLFARGTGSSFEAIQMLDEYEQLAETYKAEVAAAAAEEDRENHLPLGSHLLPQDYQDFLYSWNKAIATAPGCSTWNGADRQTYKSTNKEAWAKWVAQNKDFRKRYAAEVEQVIAYQASHEDDSSSEEDRDEELHSLNWSPFPSLPPSPIAMMEQPDTDGEGELEVSPDTENFQILCSSCNYRNTLSHTHCYMCGNIPVPQEIPQILSAEEFAEQPDTDDETVADSPLAQQTAEQTAVVEPKKPRNPIYINYKWRSPIAKVFVQHIRGRNAWNNQTWWRRYGRVSSDSHSLTVWGDSTFRGAWLYAGNTELRLTHDNCMRYLARRMGLTVEALMEKTPHEVHAKLIGEYHGIRGFYTKRFSYLYGAC